MDYAYFQHVRCKLWDTSHAVSFHGSGEAQKSQVPEH